MPLTPTVAAEIAFYESALAALKARYLALCGAPKSASITGAGSFENISLKECQEEINRVQRVLVCLKTGSSLTRVQPRFVRFSGIGVNGTTGQS